MGILEQTFGSAAECHEFLQAAAGSLAVRMAILTANGHIGYEVVAGAIAQKPLDRELQQQGSAGLVLQDGILARANTTTIISSLSRNPQVVVTVERRRALSVVNPTADIESMRELAKPSISRPHTSVVTVVGSGIETLAGVLEEQASAGYITGGAEYAQRLATSASVLLMMRKRACTELETNQSKLWADPRMRDIGTIPVYSYK